MPDWTQSMEQSFEYYTVDPRSLADIKRLDVMKSASFSRDAEAETLGSATLDVSSAFGETYVRGYLKTIQNGVSEKHPIGTVLVQTPSSSFNGKIMNVSMDAYTPLIELKENKPPLGYTIRKGRYTMDEAYKIVEEYTRVPVTQVSHKYVDGKDVSPTLPQNFVANTDDTWLSFVIDLIATADYELGLDELGHIMFQPKQDISALQPVWTYDDGNSSILYPELSISHDLYDVPNVVEVVYSYGNQYFEVTAENNDPNSIVSIASRGRRITYRETNPSLSGYVTKDQVQAYAERLLRALSTVTYTVSYTHAYCPVRVGDCVRLNYEKAGLTDIKAKVISQNIKCVPGCPVSEKAIFTNKLWG